MNEGVREIFLVGVWEPFANKLNSLLGITEAICCILTIDDDKTVTNA